MAELKLDGADKRNTIIDRLLTELQDAQFADLLRRFNNSVAQSDRQFKRIAHAMSLIRDAIPKTELYAGETLLSKVYDALLTDD